MSKPCWRKRYATSSGAKHDTWLSTMYMVFNPKARQPVVYKCKTCKGYHARPRVG